MARKKQKVTKEVESINIDIADNGFVINYSGRDDEDNWTDSKIVVNNLQELLDEIKRIVAI